MVGFRVGRWVLGAIFAAAPLLPAPAGAVDYVNVTVQPDRAAPAVSVTVTAPVPRGTARAGAPGREV